MSCYRSDRSDRSDGSYSCATWLLVAAALLFVGCGGEQAPDEGRTTLVVWDWHAADPSKGPGLWLKNIDEDYQRLHYEVRIKHVAQSHDEYLQIIKAAAASKSGPDVIMMWSGTRVLERANNLLPLTDYVTPEFRKQLAGWEDVCEGFDPAATPYAVPIAIQGLVWYYNKTLLRKAGEDFAGESMSWDDFLKACEAVAKTGKAGIACGEEEGYWAEWFLGSASLQTLSPDDVQKLRRGDMKWTDPKVIVIFEKLKELDDRGCFQKGAMSTRLFPDAGEIFMRGDAAFFLGLISDVAHWKQFSEFIAPEDLGVMTCPVFQPGPTDKQFPASAGFAYCVTRWSKHPKEAFDYIAYIANEANADTFVSQVGSFPANQRYDRSLLTNPTGQVIAKWLAGGQGGSTVGNWVTTPVNEAIKRECQRLLSGQTDVAGAAAAIEAAAAGERARGARAE